MTMHIDETMFISVDMMPTSLIQEFEDGFDMSKKGIQICLDEGLTVGEIRDICHSFHTFH